METMVLGWFILLIVSLWFQVQMTVAINTWYGKFYDLLQNAGDYVDKPNEGIELFFSQLISLDYILNGLREIFLSCYCISLHFLSNLYWMVHSYLRIKMERGNDL
jgi:ABC-type long-subunit fatty acid transport system fused permease/ATPase subunit